MCPECSDLLDAVADAANDYAKSALALLLGNVRLPTGENLLQHSETKALGVNCDKARRALDAHQLEHGC